ncbi:MAG: HNH endonuclease [Deltaproteobacteria bacterium]|nr:HNH endonuclease [Deltaproteobacteria bacterium]
MECFLNREDPLPKATRASTSVPNTQAKAIPAAIKHQVNQRDQGQCQIPQCTNTRFIDFHHIQPISKRGDHQLENIITLCASHHKMMHLSGHGLSEQAIKPSKEGLSATEI